MESRIINQERKCEYRCIFFNGKYLVSMAHGDSQHKKKSLPQHQVIKN